MKMFIKFASGVILSFGAIAVFAAPAGDDAAARAEVAAAVTSMNKAYAANDIETYFSFYADDAMLVTSAGSEQTVAEYHAEWKALIDAGGGVTAMDQNFSRSIRILADGNTAVAYYIGVTVSYRFPDGSTGDSTFAETDVWSRIDGAWKVVHLHFHESAAAE